MNKSGSIVDSLPPEFDLPRLLRGMVDVALALEAKSGEIVS